MSYGRGYGVPWGGGPLTPVSSPTSEVGGEPVTIDFTDEPDGKFPSSWEFFVRTFDPTLVATPDPTPFPAHYRVEGGRAWFAYDRQPSVGAPYQEVGYYAAPTGIVLGPNVEVGVIFVPPTALLDPYADSFSFEVGLALRADAGVANFVGARVRAEYSGGVWTTPVALEAVQATGGDPSAIASHAFAPDDLRDLIDVWVPQALAELRVRLVGSELIATLNGVWIASATVPFVRGASPKVAVFARAVNTRGVSRVTAPSIAALQFRTLRDLTNLKPAKALPGHAEIDTPPLDSQMLLPLADLVSKGLFKRRGGRQWVAAQDCIVEVRERRYAFKPGNIVRSVEPFVGQDEVPCVFDLALMRANREEGY